MEYGLFVITRPLQSQSQATIRPKPSADLSFYEFTRGNLVPILYQINATSKQFGDKPTIDIKGQISQTYNDITNVHTCKNFYINSGGIKN
jgi:hypothetical protein